MTKKLFQKAKMGMQLFILTILLFGFKAKAQQCSGLILENQAQVNAFIVDNPTCTQILGDLIIIGGDITSLTPLSNLTSVGGAGSIQNNPLLNNLNGLNSLTSIGGYLDIRNNAALNNVSGLSSLTSIGGYLVIRSNDSLLNLNGLSSLTSIGGAVYIVGNPALTNVDGLSNLTSVGTSLEIGINNALTNLNGLNSLVSIGGYLYIDYNATLANISGLQNINLANIGILGIIGNPALAVCNLPNICTFLSGPDISDIYDNLADCADEAAVVAACNTLSISERYTNKLSYYPNPVKDIFNLFNNREINHVSVINMLGQIVINQNVDAMKSAQIDMTSLPAGKYLVKVTSEGKVKMIKVVK